MSFALNRANSVYLCVFAVFLLGIWVILDLGSAFLTAPRDMTGTWRLINSPTTLGSPPNSAAAPTAAFTVAQSGRFLRLNIEHGPTIDLILAKPTDIEHQTLQLQGQGWNVTGTGSGVSDTLNFKFQPPPSQESPPSGTYQRQRMGQEPPSSPTSPPRSSSPSPNAAH